MKTIFVALLMATSALAYADTNQPPISISNRLDAKIDGLNLSTQRVDNILEILLSGLLQPETTWDPPIHLHTNLPPEYIPQLNHSYDVWSYMVAMNLNVKEISFRELFDTITDAYNLRYEVTNTNLLFYINKTQLLNQR